jgi:hypothetical protein
MKVRIVQVFLSKSWAEMHGPCVLTGEPSTGTFEVDDYEEWPVKLSVLGPGPMGTLVEVPPELEHRVPKPYWEHEDYQ